MLERTDGLIVRVRPLTETSLIVHWVTRAHGRLATVAKGARRPKSAFQGRLDLFFWAELVWQRSRRSELHLLREVTVLDAHADLRTDWERVRLAGYAVQLLEASTETETPIPALFELLLGLVRHLNTHPAQGRVRLAYEVKLLALLGWPPEVPGQGLSDAARALLRELARRDWEALGELNPTPHTVREVDAWLRRLWRGQAGVGRLLPEGPDAEP